MPSHCLLAFMGFGGESGFHFIEDPLCVISFSLAAFQIPSLSLGLSGLTVTCLGVLLFEFIPLGVH